MYMHWLHLPLRLRGHRLLHWSYHREPETKSLERPGAGRATHNGREDKAGGSQSRLQVLTVVQQDQDHDAIDDRARGAR